MSSSTSLSDDELVRRFVTQHDENAFAEIVSRYSGYLHSIAVNYLRSSPDAEEVVQDVFIRAHRKLVDFRGDCSLKTWLTTVVTNLARNRYWHRWRRRYHVSVSLDHPLGEESDSTFADILPCDRSGPRSQVVTDEFAVLVEKCMAQLTPPHREILGLRAVLNQTYEEISQALGITVGTVKSRIGRARTVLLREIRNRHPEFGENPRAIDFLESLRAPDSGLRRA